MKTAELLWHQKNSLKSYESIGRNAPQGSAAWAASTVTAQGIRELIQWHSEQTATVCAPTSPQP